MCTKCVFTVASLMCRRLAVSRFEAPSATNRNTSTSRSLNVSRGVRTCRMSRLATAGDNTASPAAAARTARTSSSRSVSFNR